ncbi:hypothetical protein niasHS_014131 [Heterodera schachtii]
MPKIIFCVCVVPATRHHHQHQQQQWVVAKQLAVSPLISEQRIANWHRHRSKSAVGGAGVGDRCRRFVVPFDEGTKGWFRLENPAPPTDFSVLAKDAEIDQCSENRSNVSPKRHKGKKGQMICKVNGQPTSGDEQCQDMQQQQQQAAAAAGGAVHAVQRPAPDGRDHSHGLILKALMELNGHRFCHFAGEQQMPYFILIKLNLFIFN